MPIPYSLDQSCALLAHTPPALTALLSGLPEPWIRGNEGPDTFSPFDVIGHLIDGEEGLWLVRAQRIRDQGADRKFAPFDRFRHKTRNVGRTLDALLAEFAQLRQANLATVRGWNLGERDLELTGEHPDFGTVTLRQLLATWAVHDMAHTAQIARVMAKQYAEAVGPWQTFLPILAERVAN